MSDVINMDHVSPPATLSAEFAREFEGIVRAFPASYFNFSDISSIENLINIKNEIRTLNAVIKLLGNISDKGNFVKYDKYSTKRNSLLKIQMQLESSLRLNVASRREVRANTGFSDTDGHGEKQTKFDKVTQNSNIW